MGVTVDPAELLFRLEQSGGAPPQRHGSASHRFTFREWSWQISIIDSTALVDRNVRASVGGTPSWEP